MKTMTEKDGAILIVIVLLLYMVQWFWMAEQERNDPDICHECTAGWRMMWGG